MKGYRLFNIHIGLIMLMLGVCSIYDYSRKFNISTLIKKNTIYTIDIHLLAIK